MNSGSTVRAILGLAAMLLAGAAARGKAPPDWVKPFLAEDATWSGKRPAVQLVDFSDVRYVTEDRVRRLRRSAIRLGSENGRARTTAIYVYNADTEKIVSMQAWVISADGRTSEAFGASQFSDVAFRINGIFWPQQRVLGFPGANRVAIGGTLAWEIQVESQAGISDINWTILSDLPVGLTALEVTPLPGGRIEWHATSDRLPAPGAGVAPGALRWEMRHLLPPTGDRPDGFLPEPQLLSARGVPAQGSARLQTWADMARVAAEIIEPRIVLSQELKAKAAALVTGKNGRWERIRALTEFVQRDIAYLGVVLDKDYLAGYRPRFAGDVLRDRHGDCKDKAALLAALVRAIDESAHVILVFSGNPKAVREGWPSAAFNHAITGLAADEAVPAGWPVVDAGPLGRLVLFDATDPTTPLGVLAGNDQGGFGLIASPTASALVPLPIADAAHNSYDCRIEATLDEAGNLVAKIDEVTTGIAAAALRGAREQLRNERFTQVLEARLHETIPVLQELHWTDQWEPAAGQWQLNLDFKAERYARRTGGTLMLVSPLVIFAKMRLTPWKTTQDGVAWVAASTVRKQVRLALPATATVEELPEDVHLELANAACALTYKREVNAVLYRYELTQKAGFLPKADYEALRGFMQKVQDAERRPVVMRRAMPQAPEVKTKI